MSQQPSPCQQCEALFDKSPDTNKKIYEKLLDLAEKGDLDAIDLLIQLQKDANEIKLRKELFGV